MMKISQILCALLGAAALYAQPLKIIGVEEHLMDPAIAKASREATLKEAPYAFDWGVRVQERDASLDSSRPRILPSKEAFAMSLQSVQDRLAQMDKNGIDMQILSYGGAPQLLAMSDIGLIKQANDNLAKIVQAHPTRFAGFATLPWQDPQAALEELRRAAKLGLKGVLINGRPSEAFLDDPRYDQILAELSELEMPLYIHPGLPHPDAQRAYYSGFDKEMTARLSLFGWGWHDEAGIQTLRLVLSGAFDKHPNLRVISGHWGEMVPFWLARLDDSFPREATGLKRSVSETYKEHVFVTPSGMTQDAHFEFIYKTLGADRIIFSVDYPFLSLSGARAWLEGLNIPQEDKEKIAYKNAQKLFKLK